MVAAVGALASGSIHDDSPVEDPCPVLFTVGDLRNTKYAYYNFGFVLTFVAVSPCTLFRLVFPPDGYTREIPTGTRSCPRYLGAAVSLASEGIRDG